MIYDTLELKLTKVLREDDFEEDLEIFDVECDIVLNSKAIEQHSKDLFELLFKTEHKPSWATQKETNVESNFYPFTCSCGNAGCAGIWNGIFLKQRKNTISWKIPKPLEKFGYEFLDKSFYLFNKKDYEETLKTAWSEFKVLVTPKENEDLQKYTVLANNLEYYRKKNRDRVSYLEKCK